MKLNDFRSRQKLLYHRVYVILFLMYRVCAFFCDKPYRGRAFDTGRLFRSVPRN